jgi:exopolysaccharide biosynthesis polyprenyl glycosylphosphotransferase
MNETANLEALSKGVAETARPTVHVQLEPVRTPLIPVSLIPESDQRVRLGELAPGTAHQVLLNHLNNNRFGLFLKRSLDVFGAGLGLLAISPILMVLGLIIKITSRGPIFFAQERVGQNGQIFKMYKLRSMRTDAEAQKAFLMAKNEADGPVFKIKNDPRITPIGRWIRKYSLDELPQLWNVFSGDMSLVGPRPPIPTEVAKYTAWEKLRLTIKPGLTCIWQVSGRSKIGFQQWVMMDVEYIRSWSLMLDIKILSRTLPAVLKGDGAW